jgi:hypothetical protein
MSKGTIPHILKRIDCATMKSPIAVFKTERGLDAVFAATIDTWTRIGAGDPDLLGVFHGGMNMAKVQSKLEEA